MSRSKPRSTVLNSAGRVSGWLGRQGVSRSVCERARRSAVRGGVGSGVGGGAVGAVAGRPRPAALLLVVVTGRAGSGGWRQRADLGECGEEVLRPGPAGRHPQRRSASVVGESSGNREEPSAQRAGRPDRLV